MSENKEVTDAANAANFMPIVEDEQRSEDMENSTVQL